jgi:hypothetical protein
VTVASSPDFPAPDGWQARTARQAPPSGPDSQPRSAASPAGADRPGRGTGGPGSTGTGGPRVWYARRSSPRRRRASGVYVQLRRDTGLPVLPIALLLRVGLGGNTWDSCDEFDTPRQAPPGRSWANRRRQSPDPSPGEPATSVAGCVANRRRQSPGSCSRPEDPATHVAGSPRPADPLTPGSNQDDPATHVAGSPRPGDPPTPGSNQVVFGAECHEFFGDRHVVRFNHASVALPGLKVEDHARGENLLGEALSALME